MADIKALVRLATTRLGTSPVDRTARFYRITEEVVRGTGITNKSDITRITKKVRNEMSAGSGRAKKAQAAARKASKELSERISP